MGSERPARVHNGASKTVQKNGPGSGRCSAGIRATAVEGKHRLKEASMLRKVILGMCVVLLVESYAAAQSSPRS
jgi:hypothetical protein